MEETLGFSISQLVGIFESYAKNLKAIGHNEETRMGKRFVHLNIEDLQTSLTNGVSFPAIFLQTPEVDKTGGTDNISEQYDFTYIVLVPKAKSRAIQTATAKAITDKLYNRLLFDVNSGVLPGIPVGTSEGEFGPVGDGLFGWAVNCSINDGYNGEVDPKDWEDLQWP